MFGKLSHHLSLHEEHHHVPPTFQAAHVHQGTFEDREAVIRLISTGRSPGLRHVSRTHLVGSGLLLERIILDSSVSIRYVRTAEQLADMLTNGAFTTTQRMSSMRLFDIRLPTHLSGYRHSIHSLLVQHFLLLPATHVV